MHTACRRFVLPALLRGAYAGRLMPYFSERACTMKALLFAGAFLCLASAATAMDFQVSGDKLLATGCWTLGHG